MNHKGKILVVDDDRLVLATLTHGLSQAGYEVIDADNGDDAILLAHEHKPELALLDIRMEGKTGFDVAAYLREYCQIPFMFLSAFADEATVAQVKELGAVTYLVKPLDIQQIVPAVESAFANRRKNAAEAEAQARQTSTQAKTSASSSSADPLAQTVALAVGIVMHRHSMARGQALDRLRKQAQQEGRSLEAWCERLLDAQDVLSGLGPLN
ncbi:response regulator [Aquabacterium sp.]|uniref:response regulator n=1 Tax=Aquabacterium sp. TaxID=1872578 RepID=UPI0025BD876C|nr:response regulator [Aquabacterium sp.]